MFAMLMLIGEALLFLASRVRIRLWERLVGRTLFLRSGMPGAWLRSKGLGEREADSAGEEVREETSLSSASNVGDPFEVARRRALGPESGVVACRGAPAAAGVWATLAMAG